MLKKVTNSIQPIYFVNFSVDVTEPLMQPSNQQSDCSYTEKDANESSPGILYRGATGKSSVKLRLTMAYVN